MESVDEISDDTFSTLSYSENPQKFIDNVIESLLRLLIVLLRCSKEYLDLLEENSGNNLSISSSDSFLFSLSLVIPNVFLTNSNIFYQLFISYLQNFCDYLTKNISHIQFVKFNINNNDDDNVIIFLI
jgi:hypothetical protein